jgi:hypothetical protein
MPGPAVGDRLAVPLDDILVAKPCAADVHAPGVDLQAVVEPRRLPVADVRLDRHRFDALLAQRRVAAAEARQVVDARDLEPDQVLGVVGDALGIRLGEADANVGVEVEAVDEVRLYG